MNSRVRFGRVSCLVEVDKIVCVRRVTVFEEWFRGLGMGSS